MSQKHVGGQSVSFPNPPSIIASASVVGKKEGEGPLKDSFDVVSDDTTFGEETWEKSESAMQKKALETALSKAGLTPADIQYIFAGDLLNQCIGSVFSLRDMNIPFFGLYGACSTMAESLALAAMTIDGGFADKTAAVTSSHFCSAERQFRFPLEYGGQRTPTAQWTVTGAGAVILAESGPGPYVKHVTCGKIVDKGIKDANNMGAAMAPAAYDTLTAHFKDLALEPSYYDMIVTGDLGLVGADILTDLLKKDGLDIMPNYNDCGLMIYARDAQDVHAGGSGCGCSASVLSGHLLDGMRAGRWKNILFAATGALLSPTSTMQGESIPCICCAVSISTAK
ncbi:stage V sporulation protein AD [Oscillospiraceae bacterium CM]|nr:stage V sporulation protein AD [Oscillospiraceae bacterium CM]